MNKHLEAFISCNSLANARKLVAHVNRHPMVMCMLTEDHAGMVRNAQRMVDHAKWRDACRPPVTPLAAATTCKLAEAANRLADSASTSGENLTAMWVFEHGRHWADKA